MCVYVSFKPAVYTAFLVSMDELVFLFFIIVKTKFIFRVHASKRSPICLICSKAKDGKKNIELTTKKKRINQAPVVCLPSQASSDPIAWGRALLGRACQEQFLASTCQPPVSACLHQKDSAAELCCTARLCTALHCPALCRNTLAWLHGLMHRC